MKKLTLILVIAITLVLLAGTATAAAGDERGFIRVNCSVDGAVATLISINDGDAGTQTVQNGYAEFTVYTTATPIKAVRVEAPGYVTSAFDVPQMPAAGKTVYVQANLVAVPNVGGERGVIQIASNVDGAAVELISVNGDVLYNGTIQNGQAEFPVYTTGTPITQVRVSAPGYTTGTQPVLMPGAGGTSRIEVTLTPVPATPASPIGAAAGLLGLLGAAVLLRRE
jgi:hypothetical protein